LSEGENFQKGTNNNNNNKLTYKFIKIDLILQVNVRMNM